MTQDQRREYSALSIRQQKRIEGKYTRQVYAALRITVDDFIASAKATSLQQAANNLYLIISNEQLANVLREIHQVSGLFFGRKAYREIEASARQVEKAGFGFNLKWITDIANWFLQDLLQTVSNISNTTRNEILEVLTKAQTEGLSFEDIENRLVGVIRPQRARLIARTETAKGAFVGRQLAARDSKWESQKEWISAIDHRTRHGHRLVNGELIDLEGRFQVSYKGGVDMMEGPGDPSAHVSNLANCRCAQAMKAKRDADGKLIPKQQLTTQNI